MGADDRRSLAAALDATTARALPAIFLGVGSFYLVALAAAPFVLDASLEAGFLLRWALMAAVGFVGAWRLRSRPAPAGWGNSLAGLLGFLAMANSLLLVDTAGPTFLIAPAVVVVAFSLFILSWPWVMGLAVFALTGWSLMAQAAGWGPDWGPRTFYVVAFCIVALVAQATRLGLHRRLEVLKARDLQRMAQENELAREKALSTQRGRIVRMTAHELATPLTPVLLQAHLLAQSELSPEQREHLDALRRNLDRLHQTVKKIIKAAKADEQATAFFENAADDDFASRDGRP